MGNARSERAWTAKTLFSAAIFFSLINVADADESLIPNSFSPDGRFAVYAVDSKNPDSPRASLEIRSLKDQQISLRLEAGGYVMRASAYDFGDEDINSIYVLWNPAGSRVAMMVREGKRNGSLVICDRRGKSFREKTLSDVGSSARKALKIQEGERYDYDFPMVWLKNDELSVKIRCDGIDPADSKPYQYELALDYNLNSGKLTNFKILSKVLFEG